MKKYSLLCLQVFSVCLVLSTFAYGQARYEAVSGQNTLALWLVNRSEEAYPQLKVRFASDKPSWIISANETSTPIQAFSSERSAKREAIQVELPFIVAQSGYANTDVKLELVNNTRVIGTVNVFFYFPDVSTRIVSQPNAPSTVSVLEGVGIPTEFALRQNFLNPFNSPLCASIRVSERG